MEKGRVIAISICPIAGDPMQLVQKVRAIKGLGLEGDRYATGNGSFNKGEPGKRQVTLINAIFFPNSGFEYVESRRNLVIEGTELMWLIGREFTVCDAVLRGIKYCEPCTRPSRLAGKPFTFKEKFFDRGGLVADVIKSGVIEVGGPVIPPPKSYQDP